MFDKFGEFDSYEEINRAAKAQLEEGDLEAIKTIAEENGLDPEDAEDFCTGAIEELTTPRLGPMGIVVIIGLIILLYNKCEWFRNGVNAIFGGIADFVKGVINKIKGFFNFEWKLPKIKLPHFKASGEWSLVPPKVPKFSVDWYANGGILNSPTIFGMNGDRAMGGGEAGAEAVLPIELLKTYILY